MAENARHKQSVERLSAPCGNANSSHIEKWAGENPRATKNTVAKHTVRDPEVSRAGTGGQAAWGGDQIDPRLFYFRALLASGRFFGDAKCV